MPAGVTGPGPTLPRTQSCRPSRLHGARQTFAHGMWVRLGRHQEHPGFPLHKSPHRLPRGSCGKRKVVFKKLIVVTAAVLTTVLSPVSALVRRRVEDSSELTTSLTNHSHNPSYH